MSQKFEKLKALLKELFQLDQPELDFGIYRIMHARSAEVSQFLDKDLLPQVKQAFAQYRTADKAELEMELAKAIEAAQALGVDPESTQKVKDLRARLANEALDTEALEAEVYDHLYSFFRRYYSEGDFLSKRVYKPGVYAIPYEGEEVKLHWANADQYYIKTSEYLRDYAFRLRPEDERNPMRVHFRLVDAAEGEHGNVKERAGKERRFKLAPPPFAAVENGELVIRFTYEPDPAKQKDLNAQAESAILTLDDPALADWIGALDTNHVRADGTASELTRLRVHLDRYTARNTFDYFIHKDLGGFLRRELDFYIKNEVMHLDDVEDETAPRVEQYLSKIKVIRRIAHKIIDFLAQLEDFQKKLWLKRKFVTETNYCISLDRIPEHYYTTIAQNEKQQAEWFELFGVQTPLTVESMKSQTGLTIDTRHFDRDFVNNLIAEMPALDSQTDGLLIHSDNFGALNLIRKKLRNSIHCIYIDPPYNTGKDEFIYKDQYRSSSWLTAMLDRTILASELLAETGIFLQSVSDHEVDRLRLCLDKVWGRHNLLTNFIWNNEGNIDNQSKVKVNHEYIVAYCKNERLYPHAHVIAPDIEQDSKLYNKIIENSITKNGPANPPSEVLLPVGFPASFDNGIIPPRDNEWPHLSDPVIVNHGQLAKPARAYSGWSSRNLLDAFIANGCQPIMDSKGLKTWFQVTHTGAIYCYKERKNQSHVLSVIRNVGTVKKTSGLLANMGFSFSYPKPVDLIGYLLQLTNRDNALVLDYYAGSGTTAHAAIELARCGKARRRYILADHGVYFDNVIRPRIRKAIYSPSWANGKPTRAHGVSHLLKYIRLESYEDTLNNLELRRTETQQSLLDSPQAQGADGFREQYLLRYMLDVESRGSQSLVNVSAFLDPTAYKLKVKRLGSDESREVNVDLLETFNWLVGLKVDHIAAPRTYSAEFQRDNDPDLAADTPRRLLLDGRLREDPEGPWWFRTVTGTTPDGRRTLVIWRKRPGEEDPEGIERDNLVLDEWFRKQGYSSRDSEFDLIYVNGDNNLENLKAPDDTWKVRLIEEDFFRLMFDTEGM